MKEVKEFIEAFFTEEATKNTNEIRPDIESYNHSVDRYNSMVIEQLNVGLIDKLKDEDFYELYEDQSDFRLRHLLKISGYKHNIYGDVWIAYVSQSNPRPKRKYLKEAIFIIKENGGFKVARTYIYSMYDTGGEKYNWEGLGGYRDLTFESAEGPVAIERYQEPLEDFDGLKHYTDDI